MHDIAPILGIVIFVALVVAILVFHFSRAKSILEQWAETNRYEIMSSEHRWFGGPFWWRKSGSQEVYYVTIRTLDGQMRRGWIRCGGWFLGVLSNHTDVQWAE
jgi:hypothetical protein